MVQIVFGSSAIKAEMRNVISKSVISFFYKQLPLAKIVQVYPDETDGLVRKLKLRAPSANSDLFHPIKISYSWLEVVRLYLHDLPVNSVVTYLFGIHAKTKNKKKTREKKN